jgi:hypothetical protein
MRCCLRSRWPGGWMRPRPSARWSAGGGRRGCGVRPAAERAGVPYTTVRRPTLTGTGPTWSARSGFSQTRWIARVGQRRLKLCVMRQTSVNSQWRLRLTPGTPGYLWHRCSQLNRGFDGQPPRGPDIFGLGMWHWDTSYIRRRTATGQNHAGAPTVIRQTPDRPSRVCISRSGFSEIGDVEKRDAAAD